LALARAHDLRSLAYPAISTGVYGFPPDRAARIAVGTVHRLLAGAPEIDRVVFACFGRSSRDHHARACEESEFQQPTLEAVHPWRQIPREQGLARVPLAR
jgi:O-acetyl-ADP-ribose deacetylase (regulator of RNase III)